MHLHAHAGTRVHEATSLTGLVPERVQLTVHTTEPTGTVPEPFHCDHIARWSARSGTSGRSGTGLNTGNWNGSGTVLVSNLWCEHGISGPLNLIRPGGNLVYPSVFPTLSAEPLVYSTQLLLMNTTTLSHCL